MRPRASLLIADSEHNADMLYVTGIFVPDPFIVVRLDRRWHGLFSPLEIDRARKTSRLDQVHLDVRWREEARRRGWGEDLAAVAAAFLRAQGVDAVLVPDTFPLLYAERMRIWGLDVRPKEGPMFPDRAIKSKHEIAELRRAERLTRGAMRMAERFLAAAGIGGDGILRHPETGRRLKSDHVRTVIETFLIARGAVPAHTIVACGRQSADPHRTGKGYLRAHRPIIIDIFPRLTSSGYWGDMTRTYVKGRAAPEIRRLYRTVREGQDIGLSMIADGVHGKDIHAAICRHFETRGFLTGVRRGRQHGFFHGTGHGVGLEVHEAPRISSRDEVLRSGHVVTVEPGLYYPGIGGVRLEDLVVVRAGGHENLTAYPRRLEVP